jgi:hypothetical protein
MKIQLLVLVIFAANAILLHPSHPKTKTYKPLHAPLHDHLSAGNITTTSDDVTLLGVTGKSGLLQITDDGSSMFYWLM